MKKIVDISGYGHSGKGAVCDILKEFDGFYVSHYNFEFNLLRVQDGLIDLKSSLVDNWSPIRSNSSIKRFKNLVKRIGPKASFLNPSSIFYSNGMNYDSYFKNKFSKISEEYINSLIDYEYVGEWPFTSIVKSPFHQLFFRIGNNLGFLKHRKETIYISSGLNFLENTRNYLDQLFREFSYFDCENIVINNAFEPFDPLPSIQLFHNAKSIIVQRDPRDIYCSTLSSLNKKMYIPDYDNNNYHQDLKRDFLNTNNLEKFIKRQKVYFNNIKSNNSLNILRIKYEELIYDYENQLKVIYEFLDIDPKKHINKLKAFNPELSKKNVGLWKKNVDNNAIKEIELHLREFCYKH